MLKPSNSWFSVRIRPLAAASLLIAAGTGIEAHAQTGACCEPDDTCAEGNAAACVTGVYQGDGSACATHCPEPTGTLFTFQGVLAAGGGVPLGGAIDLEASLWDAAVGGNQIGSTQTLNEVELQQGLFTVQLDFGAEVFNGDARWLEIAVRHPAGSGGGFTTISPRQPIRATPYAIQTRGLFVDDDLLVGMGTTDPQFRLDVRSTAPRAIFGWVTNPTGDTHGVFGQSASSQGKGVTGFASADSGETLGVYGLSSSPAGRGVYGLATANSGETYGVWGEANSPDGFAGYFDGRGSFTDDLGVGTRPGARLHVSREPTDERPTMRLDTQQDLGRGILDIVSLDFAGNAIDASSLAAGPLSLRLNPNTGGDVLLGLGGGSTGIGEVSPLAPLHVEASDLTALGAKDLSHDDIVVEDTDAAIGLYSNSGGAAASKIHLGRFASGELAEKWSVVQRVGGQLRFVHWTPDQGSDPVLRLTPDGTAEVNDLEVQGDNDGTDILVRDGEFARMRMIATDPASDVTLSIQARGSGGPDRAEIGTLSSHDVVLYSNGTVRIRIDSDGSVCIGGGC